MERGKRKGMMSSSFIITDGNKQPTSSSSLDWDHLTFAAQRKKSGLKPIKPSKFVNMW